MNEVIAIIFMTSFIILFGAGLLYLVSKVGPKHKPSKVHESTYECGLEAQTTGHTKVPVKFYLTAILFILFDIEIIFMYPWAISFKDSIESGESALMLGSMGFFILIFIFGLFWEVKSKALEWE